MPRHGIVHPLSARKAAYSRVPAKEHRARAGPVQILVGLRSRRQPMSAWTARTAKRSRFVEQPDVLDAAAGTDIFPGRVKLTAGTDAVRCLCLSSKIFRWYTDCCRTPIGNTAGPRFPLFGLIHSFISRHEADGLHEIRCSAHPFAESTSAPPSGHSRRTRSRRPRSPSSRSAHQGFSAGGYAGSVGRPRSSTII